METVCVGARQDNDRNVRNRTIGALNAPKRKPIHHRHPEVQQDRRRGAACAEMGQRLLAIIGFHDGKSFDSKDSCHDPTHCDVIVNEQNGWHLRVSLCRGGLVGFAPGIGEPPAIQLATVDD